MNVSDPLSVRPHSSFTPINTTVVVAEVDRMISADKGLSIDKKQELYNSAFTILRMHALEVGIDLELQKSLFKVFELYVAKTCYAQKSNDDEEEGFRKSARLMELALCMQLEVLGLGAMNYEWTQFNDLEELIQSLEIQKNQEGRFFPVISQLQVDPKVVAQKAREKGLSQLIAKTLIRMTYSHQNISALINPKNQDDRLRLYEFHERFNSLTEELIGTEDIEQQRELVGYRYNRCSFLSGLKSPGDWKARLASYDPIIEAIKRFYPQGDFDGNSRMAQILNIQGLIILRSNPEAIKEVRQQAYPYFLEAFKIREQLVLVCEDEEKRLDQEFFLSNIRTALIDNLVNRDPCSIEDKEAVLMHAAALEKFLQESEANQDFHVYQSSYRAAIEKAKKIANLDHSRH